MVQVCAVRIITNAHFDMLKQIDAGTTNTASSLICATGFNLTNTDDLHSVEVCLLGASTAAIDNDWATHW
jgi:hypothetical protein